MDKQLTLSTIIGGLRKQSVFFCVSFDAWCNVPVNSYGHIEAVSYPNHTNFLNKRRLLKEVNKYSLLHIISLVTDNNP